MRIWDIEPWRLCRNHLLGEHRELHAVWAILTQGKRGYALHPETLRWQGRLRALYGRHDALVREMGARGYNHGTPLEESLATGLEVQDRYVDLPDVQIELQRAKGCSCTLDAVGQEAVGGGERPAG